MTKKYKYEPKVYRVNVGWSVLLFWYIELDVKHWRYDTNDHQRLLYISYRLCVILILDENTLCFA